MRRTTATTDYLKECMGTALLELMGEKPLEKVSIEELTATADLSGVTETGSYRVPVTVTVSGYKDVTVKGSYEVTVYITDVAPEPPADTDSQPVKIP